MAQPKNWNAVGAGNKPRLGGGKPEGLASPGYAESTKGVSTDTSLPKVASPGGQESKPASANDGGGVARPGGSQIV